MLANRYVENSLKKGLLTEMVNGYSSVLREQVLGVTKLDFSGSRIPISN